MVCPVCGKYSTRVSWSGVKDNGVQRRRICMECNYRFNTIELPGLQVTELKKHVSDLKTDSKGRTIISRSELESILALIQSLPNVYVENDKIYPKEVK